MEEVLDKTINVKLPDTDWNDEKVRFEWEAAERSYKKRDKDFWITVIAILVLVSVVLFFVKEFFLIIALMSALFLYYVLSTIPPEKLKYKITNRGVYFGETRYEWELLSRFWMGKTFDSEMIHFETILRFPAQISLVINPEDKEKIKEIVVKKLPLVEESPRFLDKLTKAVTSVIPLEKRKKDQTNEKKV